MANFSPGALVIYHGRAAAVLSAADGKIEIRIEGGAGKSVRAKDIEFLHPGPAGSLPPAELPVSDRAEIAELLTGERVSFGEFAELLTGSRSAAAYWTARKELGGAYFTGSVADGVTPRPAEETAALLETAAAKERAAGERAALLERLKAGAFLPEDRTALREIEMVARGESGASKLMRDLGIEQDPIKAHQFLIRLGVWDYSFDPWPARAGIELDAPRLPFAPPDDGGERTDFTGQNAYAIDNAGSEDPDDAVAFADGLLWVHTADPAAAVRFGDALDLESARRGTTLYLPERIVPMLPEAMMPYFGLGLAERSPALSFGIAIDAEGRAELKELRRSTVRVRRFTYETIRPLWETEEFRAMRELLERFRARRAADGARFIDLPECDIALRDGEVVITPIRLTPEREFVANAMLAAGAAVGRRAAERGLAMPFSTQQPWEGAPPAAEPGDFAGMYALRKASPPGTIQTLPGRHSGLGLDAYCRVTSPLRRYCDLLAHQQLRRVLAGDTPLTMEEMDSRLTWSEAAARDKRRLERQADEFWTLVYFTQHPEWEGDAVPVGRQDDRLTFLIPELAFEFKNRYGGRIPVGGTVRVRLQSADPAGGRAAFRIGQ